VRLHQTVGTGSRFDRLNKIRCVDHFFPIVGDLTMSQIESRDQFVWSLDTTYTNHLNGPSQFGSIEINTALVRNDPYIIELVYDELFNFVLRQIHQDWNLDKF
jgi:hypothetical protein